MPTRDVHVILLVILMSVTNVTILVMVTLPVLATKLVMRKVALVITHVMIIEDNMVLEL